MAAEEKKLNQITMRKIRKLLRRKEDKDMKNKKRRQKKLTIQQKVVESVCRSFNDFIKYSTIYLFIY